MLFQCLVFISEYSDNGLPLDMDLYPIVAKIFKAVIETNATELITFASRCIYNLVKQSCKHRSVFLSEGLVSLLFNRIFCFESDCENCCLALSRLVFNLKITDGTLPVNWIEMITGGFGSSLETNIISSYLKMISGLTTTNYGSYLINSNIAKIIFDICTELSYDQKLSALDLIHDLIRLNRSTVVSIIEEASTLEMFETFLDGDPPMLHKLFDILRDVVVEAVVLDPKMPPPLFNIFDEAESIMEAAEEYSEKIDSAMFILTEMAGNKETIENG